MEQLGLDAVAAELAGQAGHEGCTSPDLLTCVHSDSAVTEGGETTCLGHESCGPFAVTIRVEGRGVRGLFVAHLHFCVLFK